MQKHPEKGFYYHYKHDSNGEVNNYAYEVLGAAFNTESVEFHSENFEDFLKDEVVVYRPLYTDALTYKANKRFWIRPLGMFMEEVVKNGKTMPRFQKITDPKIISELTAIRDAMYK